MMLTDFPDMYRLLAAQHETARLLNYRSFAHLALVDQMLQVTCGVPNALTLSSTHPLIHHSLKTSVTFSVPSTPLHGHMRKPNWRYSLRCRGPEIVSFLVVAEESSVREDTIIRNYWW